VRAVSKFKNKDQHILRLNPGISLSKYGETESYTHVMMYAQYQLLQMANAPDFDKVPLDDHAVLALRNIFEIIYLKSAEKLKAVLDIDALPNIQKSFGSYFSWKTNANGGTCFRAKLHCEGELLCKISA